MTVVRVCDAAGVPCYFTLSPPVISGGCARRVWVHRRDGARGTSAVLQWQGPPRALSARAAEATAVAASVPARRRCEVGSSI
jgi:hypothetical protein